ncbi:Phosphatidylglycerol/phosphatidylinositol transfer protein [Mycena venus]|uniref:Phosphatidylglycerol/phosphatidylinositol transfer protein n=1 Tax=Mycena venus TaxID=2733690 RepID=A0A8H7CRN1_9AGAR|nr:Phosphatidylglycerol/phosphatidylinositol transfer protein [Mycena venus]
MFRFTTLFLFFAFLLQAYAATSGGWEYTDCGLPSNPIQIDSIEISPDPPLPGQDLTVTVKALVTDVIEEGASADVTVKLGLIKLLQKNFDVCQEARNANATVSCPVQPGPYEVVQSVGISSEGDPQRLARCSVQCANLTESPAKFVVLVRGFTVEEKDMLCLGYVDLPCNPSVQSNLLLLDLKIDFMKSISSIFTSPF